ncbi:MAG: hypothetical protein AW09_000036 [Candidatus Accumulibacter phosphatis]|uniref:Uncharacterized protein n=1 Tax=Candidatus Accumulibacter phosphatis TaxID=327160 RepID=A0A080M0E3_9PROT|nr:MAG: hypothetical protein AW09_000036 [Candidatus Accumulibacter phosphatis]
MCEYLLKGCFVVRGTPPLRLFDLLQSVVLFLQGTIRVRRQTMFECFTVC